MLYLIVFSLYLNFLNFIVCHLLHFLKLNFGQQCKIDMRQAQKDVIMTNRKRKTVFERALQKYRAYCDENNSTFDPNKYYIGMYNLPSRTENQCKAALEQSFFGTRMFIRTIYKSLKSGEGFSQFDYPFIEGK